MTFVSRLGFIITKTARTCTYTNGQATGADKEGMCFLVMTRTQQSPRVLMKKTLKTSAMGSLGPLCAVDSLELVIVHFLCSQQT